MNIIKRVKEALRGHREAGLARMRAEQEAMVTGNVGIREAGGHIWITVDGIGVRRMEHGCYHKDIMRAVEDTRKAAVAYWRATHGYGDPEPHGINPDSWPMGARPEIINDKPGQS